MEVAELEVLLRAAEKATPVSSRKKKRVPYTPDFILAVKRHLQLDKPRDAAVYSCLTTTFYTTARLGEFTVPNLRAFDPSAHVKPSDIRIKLDQNGLRSTLFHIPRTKTSPRGEDVSWSRQADGTDPEAALAHHMAMTGSYHLHHVLLSCTTQNLDQLPGMNEMNFHSFMGPVSF